MSARGSHSRPEYKSRTAPETPIDQVAATGWLLPVGLAGLLVWMAGGLTLEGLHAVKSVAYLEDALRRELWTLAHAHGTLFSALCLVIHLLGARLNIPPARMKRIDHLFATGAILLPLGFFLGGTIHPETDPNLAILLTPLGSLLAAGAIVLLILEWKKLRS